MLPTLTALFNKSRWNRSPRFLIQEGDREELDKPGTLLLAMYRDELLRYLPSDACVAEIGVYRGRFSSKIRAICRPRFLALVDKWSDSSSDVEAKQDLNYRKVYRKFNSTSGPGECRVIRKLSTEAASEFSDEFFDWVYIDADHSCQGCLEDLRAWGPKVKKDGFLCGHDYAIHENARKKGWGVIEAVRTFVQETGSTVLAITVEQYPTFVIAKDGRGPAASRFKQLLLGYAKHLIRVAPWEYAEIGHVRIVDSHSRPPNRAIISLSFDGSGRR